MKSKSFIPLAIAATSIAIASAANSAYAATVIQTSFSGKTQFGFGNECTFLPSVCALNGQGLLSGTVIYDPSKAAIFPGTNNYKPIFFEANFTGFVNSTPSQPNFINISFSTNSVTNFSITGDISSPEIFLGASFSDPNLPEFQSFILGIQEKVFNLPPLFRLETPLPGGGTRILSEGVLEFTEAEVSVPEPSALFGLCVVLGLGALSAKNKKHLRKVS
ncbi:PEP-CTERM sorting domain-containing protein [Coleofasciculus sp. FACHB-SPT9]|uniref:PEP-CTERM sorting domain-containing protein n=1 Tax=Cyanophyceae TaxID=3028117 RepID=UPI0016831ED1|nr:PEP-CTERM sorting domain-containing protein [Coleofasciculus sp. FACHB-SPT9]MBD1890239.1 PEP-CTERM sorting domain-containing protein [Coleofasciculus sp. FACHB-SPT9]